MTTSAHEIPMADAHYASVQRVLDAAVREHLISPLLDDMVAKGVLPLPPMEWGRTEPWYVGDLA